MSSYTLSRVFSSIIKQFEYLIKRRWLPNFLSQSARTCTKWLYAYAPCLYMFEIVKKCKIQDQVSGEHYKTVGPLVSIIITMDHGGFWAQTYTCSMHRINFENSYDLLFRLMTHKCSALTFFNTNLFKKSFPFYKLYCVVSIRKCIMFWSVINWQLFTDQSPFSCNQSPKIWRQSLISLNKLKAYRCISGEQLPISWRSITDKLQNLSLIDWWSYPYSKYG